LFERFVHDPFDTASLSNSWVYAVLEDEQHKIWIATRSGVNCFNPKTKSFKRILNNNIPVYGLGLGDNNIIYANTPTGLVLINTENYTIKRIEHPLFFNQAIYDTPFPVFQISENKVLIGTSSGLFIYDTQSKKVNSLPDFNNHAINTIHKFSSDKVLIGTNRGIFLSDLQLKNGSVNINSGTVVNSLAIDSKKQIWTGTNAGLFQLYFDIGTQKTKMVSQFVQSIETHPNYLTNNDVQALLIDKSENLWIGTLNGLDKVDLKAKKFKLYRNSNNPGSVNLLDNVIAAIFINDNNDIWIGNWGKGLNIYNRENKTVVHYTSSSKAPNTICNDFVHAIFKDTDKNIWIGTRNGVQIFDTIKQQFVHLNIFFNSALPLFENIRVSAITEDKNKNIYIATHNGLFIINYKRDYYKHLTSESKNNLAICSNLIYTVITDLENKIWIGTLNGVNIYNPDNNSMKKIVHEPGKRNTLIDNFVVSLYQDSEKNIWIGSKSGLNIYTPATNTFGYYSIKDGLPGSTVYEIIEDNNKDMWFTTGYGLGFLDRDKGVFKKFDLNDGLQSMEFNLQACYKAQNGELFFGGMNGVNAVHPDSIFYNPYIPDIEFNTVSFVNPDGKYRKLIQKGDTIFLNYNDENITIEFSAMEFTNPERNNYAYKISKNTTNWIELGNRRFISFSEMAAGKYQIFIKASNNDNIWNNAESFITIIVHPPFWQSKLAYISYAIIVILLFFLLIKLRERKLKFEKAVLENKVEQRTLQINEQNKKLELAYTNIQALSKIGKEVTSHITINEIINVAYSNINELIEAPVFGVGIVNVSATELEFINAVENNALLTTFKIMLSDYTRPAVICFHEKRTIVVNNNYENKQYALLQPVAGNKTASYIYLPLITKSKILGVLTVQSFNPNVYLDYHVDILQNIATYISIALENAEAYKHIENQKNKIAQSHAQITDSINYAWRIQMAVLPSDVLLNSLLGEYFTFFKPKQIVSGDFYWVRKSKNTVLVAVGDCTGHGVPGAFVSLLAISFLNEIVHAQQNISPAIILELLRDKVKQALRHSNETFSPKDGLDIALCAFSTINKTVSFSGAYNPLYIVRDNQLLEFKATKNPIGIYLKEIGFFEHQIDLLVNDMIYMFSDGFVDQFGGDDGGKFKFFRFKAVLKSMAQLPVSEQHRNIYKQLSDWIGTSYKQIDDILILGVKYTGQIINSDQQIQSLQLSNQIQI